MYKCDFQTYCQDYCKLTGVNLSPDHDALSFSEMLDASLINHPEWLTQLHQAERCIIAHDDYERNPFYAHVGTYLINRYELCCDVFDVIGSGSMPAVKVAEQLVIRFREVAKSDRVVIFSFSSQAVTLVLYTPRA